jgi:hypothetical protein
MTTNTTLINPAKFSKLRIFLQKLIHFPISGKSEMIDSVFRRVSVELPIRNLAFNNMGYSYSDKNIRVRKNK